MKTQCDGCQAKVASVFCYVKEMALCSFCGLQCVHHDHHQHLPFFYPIPKNIPICDICQETKSFIFCVEHRAIICRVCDVSLHTKDELKKKHSRFLLTGAKLCSTRAENHEISLLKLDHSSPTAGHQNDQSGGSTSSISSEYFPGHEVDMSSDDPYGLLSQLQKRGEGAGSAFADADLGCFLSSLSPKNSS